MNLQSTTLNRRAILISAGGACTVTGALALAGWVLHIPALTRAGPSFSPMVANAALGFVLDGLALILLACGWPRAGLIGAGWSMLLGTLTLAEWGLAVDFGIDQMLAAHTIMSQSAHPGRAAPNTALCFVLSGLALWWGSRPRRPGKTMAAIGVLGAVVLSMGTAAVLGYLARCPTYAWGPWSQMAANTGFGFIALGLGIVIMPSSCSNGDSRATVGWPAVATVCAGLTITLSFAYGLDREMQSHSTHVFGLGLQLARDSPASAILAQREGQMILLTAATITGIVCSVLSGFLTARG